MRFIADTFRVLRDTSWPTGKQSWKDFISVIEYTAFFVVIIYLFDILVSRGLLNLLHIF
ncbi:preprotein translocase subunit SecE [Streptococcus himalayensis]|uniref:Preprotein translocase subunit SecE n=1 Tax=Streptococcus himalayensis TaxID=1888195 RepID=A0A917EE75_9STRE|nr:preprotein translocase subunit SecE [Streptococcus himalayensis]GGE24695.1 preprotein translocase subunit SecE [Streptococcus himalayensis]